MKLFIKSLYDCFKIYIFLSKLNSLDKFFFFPGYGMGGAEKVHKNIVENFGKRKDTLVVFTSPPKNDFFKHAFNKNSNNIEVYELIKFSLIKYFLTKILIKKIGKNRNKIIFGSNSKYFYHILSKINIKKTPTIVDLFHSFHQKNKNGILFWSKPVQHKIHQRIVINEMVRTKLKEHYLKMGINKYPKITVINNYVEIINEKRNVNGKLKIIYLGRFCTKTKKTQYVLEIANNLLENQNCEFHLAGFNQSEAEGYNIPNNCIIHGLLNEKEVGELLLQSDLLIITSKNEGFPLVIMEAMMCGVVPITTNVGGITIHVDDSNGYLINYNSQMIQTFTGILKNISRTKIEPKSKSAKIYANKHFTKQNFISTYQKIFNK